MGQISLSTPVVGQPNSSEDPKIGNDFTILQTLLNGNIDPTNLSAGGGIMHLAVRLTTSNLAANPGDLVRADAAVTVTLPAASSNALVGVINNVAGTVTVQSGSANIYGEGLGGATSFLLGTQHSKAILQSDGANWLIISGQRDTGWVPLTLPGGVTSAGVTPAGRLVGDIVRLQGSAQTSATIPIGSTVATVPAAMRPSATKSSVGWASNMALSMLVGSGTGAISFGFAWSNVYTAEFGGVTYAL